eukprot:3032901-Lingulodinium_polyedra.AAC.1
MVPCTAFWSPACVRASARPPRRAARVVSSVVPCGWRCDSGHRSRPPTVALGVVPGARTSA